MPSLPSPEPTISCIDDLDFFKDFENKLPAIAYDDDLKSKSDQLIEHFVSSRHIDKFDSKNETSLSEYDEEEQNVLYLNDSFPLDVIFPNNLKTDKDNDDNIDITQLSRSNTINIDTKRSNKLLEASHDGIFNVRSFIIELIINIVTWNYLDNGMPLNMAPLPFRDQRHPWLMYQDGDTEMGLDVDDTLCFQLGGVRRRMTWRQFILALGLHSEEEMAEVGFGAYWQGSERVIPDKGDIRDYWIEISSGRDFLGPNPFYVFIQDPVRRLCHRMIACSISGRGQAPKKVIGVDLFYLCSMDRGTANVPHLLAQYMFRHAEGRKSGARLSGVTSLGVLQPILDCLGGSTLRTGDTWAWVAPRPERQPDVAAGAPGSAEDAPADDEGAQVNPAPVQAPQPPPPAPRTIHQRISRLEEEVNAIFRRSGKSYDPPINPNDQPNDYETPINFDSDDEDDEPTPQPKPKDPKPVKENPTPKPYKPKIPYPQRLRKEKMKAQYGKFLDMIRAVRIHVPLVDVLARMPNYGKFLKHSLAINTSLNKSQPLS
ncbi:hypothetical protein Tco_0753741 [Tanacetum coccineum]